MIELRNISKIFGGVQALDQVSFSITPGTVHAVVGENGAGKSTLMKILAGIITDYQGEMRFGDRRLRLAGPRDAQRHGISIIHQELNLVDDLSVAANLFLGREPRRGRIWLDNAAMHREAAALLAELDCDFTPATPVRKLRVGDQQLVEIAKALSLKSQVLIMDEPTSALTQRETERLFAIMRKLLSQGVTLLYISHKMDEVFELAQRITVLRDGRHVTTVDRQETNARQITHWMVGREIEDAADHLEPRTPGETVLEVNGLHLPWPGHARQWRLADISFSLRRSEVLGIAGLMGAGRTELLECLFGAADQQPLGEIKLDGRPVAFAHPADACTAGVTLVTEDRKRLGLFDHWSVQKNMTIATLRRMARAGFVSRREEDSAAARMMADLRVKAASPGAPIGSLSGGNQQKAIIARWLLAEPQVLLLDDPTRGVDVGAKAELYRLMDQLCRQGLGIIVTSSELPELLTLCDRILVLAEGRLTGHFTREEATEQRIMEAAIGAPTISSS